jgi:hypothetical protein
MPQAQTRPARLRAITPLVVPSELPFLNAEHFISSQLHLL